MLRYSLNLRSGSTVLGYTCDKEMVILWIVAVPHSGVSELEVAIELFQTVFIILCSIIIAKGRTIPKFEEKNV
jgi:hypothetical protein